MFLKNAWYCAGFTADLGQAPVGKTFLGEPIVFYRRSDGVAVALSGRCPHRFAPLHRGKIVDDAVECPYHGLVFNSAGQCIHNPHGDGQIPARAVLRQYPLEERHGVLWVWMGDPEKADRAAIIDTRFVVSPDYAVITGYLHVAANYQLVVDNLLDLTHPAILHRGGLSSEEYLGGNMETRFRQEGLEVHSEYTFRNVDASPGLRPLWGDRKSDVRAFMTLFAPSSLYLDFQMNEVNGPIGEGLLMPSLHLLVPESETSTHYFYVQSRNVELENDELTALINEVTRRAFVEEDEPMVRACQEMMGTSDLFSLKPAMLSTDGGAVRARHLLEKLIAQEQKDAQSPAPPSDVTAE